MRLLHTSDWHIGHQLFQKDRDAEHARYFEWLAACMQCEQVEALLVAGDIFDVTAPSSRSRQRFYGAMKAFAEVSGLQGIVCIGGNHDSPAVLDAPSDLVKLLRIHMVGGARSTHAEELVKLYRANGDLGSVVCAVPFLREGELLRELRSESEGVGIAEREQAIREGIRHHYMRVLEAAEAQREGAPVVAMGHLYVEGGVAKQSRELESERSLYCGNLGQVSAGIFEPSNVGAPGYVALGHLHLPQKVGQRDHIRYSGSPLPMNFEEALSPKEVCIVDVNADSAAVRTIEIPCFQKLLRFKGDRASIAQQIEALGEHAAWVQILYEGDENISEIQEWANEAVQKAGMELLSLINRRRRPKGEAEAQIDVSQIRAMDDMEMFSRFMQSRNVSLDLQKTQMALFKEALDAVRERALEGQQR